MILTGKTCFNPGVCKRAIMSNTRKVYIKTWGCQMNVYDSRRMADILAPLGYRPVETPEDADLMILNTCHIREKATDKVFSELGRLREHKDEKERRGGGRTIMAVAGCVAQAEGDFIMERAPYVDMVFGPQTYHELPEMLVRATGERVVNTEFPEDSKFDSLPAEPGNHGVSAFLSIQEGCDKFCTFCVVPYTRGAEYSRPVAAVLDEARRLAEAGAVEITLLGQNVNAYHGAGPDGKIWGLARLIEAVAEVEGIGIIRYTTSHPRDMDEDLIAAHRDVPKLTPFLHLPVQSGSDKILKAMNRKHEAALFRDIVERLRAARPDIALSSDFIVGFPGESDADFEDTMALVRDTGFAGAYSFKYSARPGTPAAAMAGLVREDVKAERLQRLQDLLTRQKTAFNRRTVGMTLPVLFDRQGKHDGQLHGRTPYNQSIHVEAPARLYGKIIDVEITNAYENSLGGRVRTAEVCVA